MVVSEKNEFSLKGLRAFNFSLAGVIVLSVVFLLGLVFFQKGNDDLAGQVRTLMLSSWWMVLSGIITFTAAYMIVSYLSALAQGHTRPLKPAWRTVFVFAIVFGLIHSLQLAYGGNLPSDFIVIFSKDLLGILVAAVATTVRPVRETMYGQGN
jgi:hypothetical protein